MWAAVSYFQFVRESSLSSSTISSDLSQIKLIKNDKDWFQNQ
jgi:hypothetical protein